MSKIVAMPGIVVQGNSAPVQSLIEMLEELLEAAKRGEARCAIIGTVGPHGEISTISGGEASVNNMMLCGLAIYEETRDAWKASTMVVMPPDYEA